MDAINPDELFQIIVKKLESQADADFAAGQRRFFRHEVETIGVRSVNLHRIAREATPLVRTWPVAARNRLMRLLWEDGRIETGALVCYIYRSFARECGACEFKLFERWIDRYVRNWAHCDGVASWLVAASVANEPELRLNLLGWTQSGTMWKRRAAAVAMVQEAKAGRHFDTIAAIARALLTDREVMVEMGIGWLLKESYVGRPAETFGFLMAHRGSASRRTLRIAAEKMPAARRAGLMAKP